MLYTYHILAVSPLEEASGNAPDAGDAEEGPEAMEGDDEAMVAEETADADGLAGEVAEGSGEAGGYSSVEAEAEGIDKEGVGIELNAFDATEMNSSEKDVTEDMEDDLTEVNKTETDETEGLTEENGTEGASDAGEDNETEDLAEDDTEANADNAGRYQESTFGVMFIQRFFVL